MLHPDETLDGIMFGMMLAANPRMRERRDIHCAKLQADREWLLELPRETLERAITERRLWTLPGVFEHRTVNDMVDAVAACLQSRDRPLWLASLGRPVG